jgi:NAD(P)-dependent dehydrogenase (short-subunit alcohol dehydrogenase family)
MGSELSGKVAVVTGGASGIGRGTAERFVAEGASVVVADVNEERGLEVAAACGDKARFKQADVSEPEHVRELVDFAVETFGGLHVMFNNAGISGTRYRNLLDDDFSDFHRVIGVNLLGVMAGTREAARHMASNGGGSIINVSSIGGIQPAPGLWTYHASKSAVIFFTKCASIDLGEQGIRVNCIAPGNIETDILGSVVAADMDEKAKAETMTRIRAYLLSRQAIKRQGTTDDIAESAVYFASDRSSYVTGTVLPVDGGMVAGSLAATRGLEDAKKASR